MRIIGRKPYTVRVKRLYGVEYWFGGGNAYVYSSGEKVERFSKLYDALENFQYKF